MGGIGDGSIFASEHKHGTFGTTEDIIRAVKPWRGGATGYITGIEERRDFVMCPVIVRNVIKFWRGCRRGHRCSIRFPTSDARHQHPESLRHPDLPDCNGPQVSSKYLGRVMLADRRYFYAIIGLVLELVSVGVGYTIAVVIARVAGRIV